MYYFKNIFSNKIDLERIFSCIEPLMTDNTLLCDLKSGTCCVHHNVCEGGVSSGFPEAKASEFLENIEDIFSRYWLVVYSGSWTIDHNNPSPKVLVQTENLSQIFLKS